MNFLNKDLKISIIFNDPVQYAQGPIYEDDEIDKVSDAVDMSEYGVLDEVRSVERALLPLNYNTKIVPVALDIHKLINELKEDRPDIIFNLCESVDGDSSQEMNIAGLFELLKIPYTGSRAFTLGLALNKPLVKQILNQNGIPTAKHFIVHSSENISINGHRFPMIVKPSREDASLGIANESIVYDTKGLKTRIEYIMDEFKQPALVEEYIDGREINVAVIAGDDGQFETLPISEIMFDTMPEGSPRIVSYEAKWVEESPLYKTTIPKCPAALDEVTAERARELALETAALIGLTDYGRIDMRLRDDGALFVLEANPNPDISRDAGFMRAASVKGFSHAQTINMIVRCAIRRVKK